jgi:hypothetical protein
MNKAAEIRQDFRIHRKKYFARVKDVRPTYSPTLGFSDPSSAGTVTAVHHLKKVY